MRSKEGGRVAAPIILGFGGLVMLYPLLWLLGSSFKNGPDTVSDPAWQIWPSSLNLTNYISGWFDMRSSTPFFQYALNSLFVGVLAVVGSVASCSLTAYAFGRLQFRFRNFWFALMLGSIMLPFEVLIIPRYLMFSSFGWINSYLPILVPQFFAQNAFLVFLVTQFVRGIPRELDEAATIDGAGLFRRFWAIILPLSVPALATAGTLAFFDSWSNLIAPLIYLSDQSKYTMPLGLAAFVTEAGQTNIGPMIAMSAFSLVVPLLVFLVCQRYVIRGLR